MNAVVLWSNILLPVVLAASVNVYIYKSGWYKNNKDAQVTHAKRLPPGWAVAAIWTVLLALLGYAHYMTFPSLASFFLLATITYCLIYPFVTRYPRGGALEKRAKLLNTITLILAGLAIAFTVMRNARAFWATLPLFAWAAYVNIVDVEDCR